MLNANVDKGEFFKTVSFAPHLKALTLKTSVGKIDNLFHRRQKCLADNWTNMRQREIMLREAERMPESAPLLVDTRGMSAFTMVADKGRGRGQGKVLAWSFLFLAS